MTSAEMFLVFWSDYPRRVAKKDAEKAWSRLHITEEGFAVIMTALALQKRTVWLDKELQWVPYPASWIRGERWEDEVDYGHGETKAETIIRQNHEAAEAVRDALRGADRGSTRGDDLAATDWPVRSILE